MNVMIQNTQGIYDELSKVIEGIQVKSLFSGYGFYYEDNMFGIYQQGIFYLKADPDSSTSLIAKGATLPEQCNNQALSNYYYGLSQEIRDDFEYLKTIVLQSIQHVMQLKELTKQKESEKIRNLPNLNGSYERLLSKIGINNVAELEKQSIEDVYIKLKDLGCIGTVKYYLILRAAVARVNILLVSEEEKQQQLDDLNEYLQSKNLSNEYFKK